MDDIVVDILTLWDVRSVFQRHFDPFALNADFPDEHSVPLNIFHNIVVLFFSFFKAVSVFCTSCCFL